MGEGRRVKRLAEQAAYIGTLEADFEKLSDEELRGKTPEFKQRLENGEALEDLIFEAYAAVREAFRRTIGVRLFDVQLMGGIVLHEGDIAEMKTGEGKTFVAVQPLYLNGLAGQGVHLVTVNDYLAKRDAEWTRPVYELLGSSVGAIQNLMPFVERREAYACDVVYGTNSEFGFDYLRDNMAVSLEGVVQRSHSYAIVDEVDSILVDEARTPLIISGEPETAAETYYQFARVAKDLDGAPATRKTAKGLDETELSGADFLYDEKFKTVSPAQATIEKVERALGIDNLYDPKHVILVNHLMQALKAQSLYKRDVDYVVQEGEVKIVDEFTGRIMEGRRWSEGLHQAIEAKEGTRIREENVTLASITLQNYFRLYERLAGMTGTAKTEEKEFVEIYDLHVVEIPTNQPVARLDENDYIFKTPEAKFSSVLDDIVERHEEGQPVLVGTIAVETSEFLSEMLKRKGIPHNVLNAKEHERESEIIKDAGQLGAVTIATNMAGRGVDIKLGEGVVDLGGLYVLGTERHESRRIDNQLRGRSGRQGDPGETRFYLSGQDDLVRLFAGDRIYNIMNRFKIPDDQPMEASILSKQIENAQKKVEEQNFVARKNVLKYDDVMNSAADGHLRAAPPRARGRGSLRRGARVDPRRRHSGGRACHGLRVRRGLGSRRARDEHAVALRHGHHGRRVARGARRDQSRRAGRRVRRGRARDLRRARAGARPGARARSRALHRPADRRRTLARAPRGDGLPTRGRPPPCVRPEGSARRVPRRGPHHVRGAQPDHPRGGRLHALPRLRAGRGAGPRADAGARQLPPLRARDVGGRRGYRCRRWSCNGPRGASRPVGVRVVRAAAGRERAQGHRSQRPVLVRERQEVQALPRRIAPRRVDACRGSLQRDSVSGSFSASRGAITAATPQASTRA